jgi:hypothetical protein
MTTMPSVCGALRVFQMSGATSASASETAIAAPGRRRHSSSVPAA